MARREYARIGVDMPEEDSIKALGVEPQWLYDRLLLRPEISRCGVVPWRPAVIAELAQNATVKKVSSWARPLITGRQVILDEPYAECLVRTYVRHDKILASPNVLPHVVYDFGLITSPKVRLAFLQELRRLWDLDDLSDSERGGWLVVVGHFPRQKHGRDDPAKWPVALEPDTLARIVSGVGTGLRDAFHNAIAAGQVTPFDPDSRHGVPDPFSPSHGGNPSPPPHPPTPSPHPTGGRDASCAPARTHASAAARPPSNRETGYPGIREADPVPVHPDDPAADAADTHTSTVDPDQLIADHVGPTTGAVRLGLRNQITNLDRDGLPATTIAAALELWSQRPGSGPGLVAYLANDLLLDDRLKTKPLHGATGSATPWCGDCDETSRWEDAGDDRWQRCPRCHPAASLATPSDSTPTPPVLLAAWPDDPPF